MFKLALLKTAVLLLAVQGLIADVLHRFGGVEFREHSMFTDKQQIQRNYCQFFSVRCALTWLQLTFFSSRRSGAARVHSAGAARILRLLARHRRPQQQIHRVRVAARPTAWWFIKQLFAVHDVFGQLAVTQPELPSSSHGERHWELESLL